MVDGNIEYRVSRIPIKNLESYSAEECILKTICGALWRMALVWGLIQFSAAAQATAIDLNDFYADPPAAVTIAPDGSLAVMAEDATTSPVLLANDPGLGDPNVIIPGVGVLLSFDYNFTEASGNNDEFGVFVLDAATGLSAGTAFEFFTQDTGSGTVSFNLSSLVGRTLGLQFQLTALPGDQGLTSSVIVSNVSLSQGTIGEPPVLLLLGNGLLAWLVFGRRRTCLPFRQLEPSQ